MTNGQELVLEALKASNEAMAVGVMASLNDAPRRICFDARRARQHHCHAAGHKGDHSFCAVRRPATSARPLPRLLVLALWRSAGGTIVGPGDQSIDRKPKRRLGR